MLNRLIPLFLVLGLASFGQAAEPTGVKAPPPASADEPIAKEFSLTKAAQYLDSAAVAWIKAKSCAACHTMPAYLMARPALASLVAPAPEVRQFFEDTTTTPEKAFPPSLPADSRSAVVIATATGLAMNDRATTGKLHATTRAALDRMWAAQRADGGWDWPPRDAPPIKDTEHYGATFAALGVSQAPDGYANTEPARKGLDGVRRFLKARPPTSLHERAMLLWVSQSLDGFASADERSRTLDELLRSQRPDGGWSIASFIANPDDVARQTDASRKARTEKGHGTEFLVFAGNHDVAKVPLECDGYATGFAIYVARQANVPANDPRLRRGIDWLKSHQRESGRWFTASLGTHKQNLISNAGTAYAILALTACEALAGKR